MIYIILFILIAWFSFTSLKRSLCDEPPILSFKRTEKGFRVNILYWYIE